MYKLLSTQYKSQYTVFLIHIGMQQLLIYIDKKHYEVWKKVTDVGFVWLPDTLFQPNDILVGLSFL